MMMVTKIWLVVAVILTTLVTFDVYDDGCENVLSGDSNSILNNSCNSYLEYKYKIKNEPNLDYVSSVDIYNLPLNDFPFPCDIAQGIFNADGWNLCVDSIKSGDVSLLDIVVRDHPYSENTYDRTDAKGDKDTCRFVNGESPKLFSYNQDEQIVYCENSNGNKSKTMDWNELWKLGILFNQSHQIYAPPFNKSLSYIDYNQDGYMDVALSYKGVSCDGSGCGGGGVIILTKKSEDGKLERVLRKCETNPSGKETLYDGHWKILCTSK
jgi:hypothetical protein